MKKKSQQFKIFFKKNKFKKKNNKDLLKNKKILNFNNNL